MERKLKEFLREFPSEVQKMKSYEDASEKLAQFIKGGFILGDEFKNTPFYFRQNEWGGTNVIYRARPNEIADTPFPCVKDISYVPEDKLSKVPMGRVNKARQAIFYGSTKFETACFETVWIFRAT